jgi:hypothetical protein
MFRVNIFSLAILIPIIDIFLGYLLATRTMGCTSISSLQYRLGLDSLPTIAATEVARILHTKTSGRPIVDVRLFETISGPATLVINDEGTIFQSSVMSNAQAMCAYPRQMISHSQITHRYPIYQPSEANGAPIGAFRRLVVGTTPSTCYIVSSHHIQQLDLRVCLQLLFLILF